MQDVKSIPGQMVSVAQKGTPVKDMRDEDVEGLVVIDSRGWPLPLWQLQHFRRIVEAGKLAALKTLVNANGRQSYVVRNLHAADIGGSSRHWNEQVSGTQNAFEASGISSNTSRDNAAIALVGVASLTGWTTVSGLRVEIAGVRPVEWDLQLTMHPFEGPGGQADLSRFYIAQQPVVVGPAKTITIRHYVRGSSHTNNTPSELPMIGIIVEPEVGGGAGLAGGSRR